MKRILVIVTLLVLLGTCCFAVSIDGTYPVKAKWSVSVFSGTVEPLDGKPVELTLKTQPDGTLTLIIPPIAVSEEYPASEEMPVEPLILSYDKKGNAVLSYDIPPEHKEAGIESVSGTIKKGALEFKIRMHVKGFPFDFTLKFSSI